MDTVFPFGFPGATAMYLVLYMVTLTVHALLVSYVLAASAYVAVHRVIRALHGGDQDDPLVPELVDWLPFGLGVAITAGVAPLLFLQILYKESFYTANLLLFHRWMVAVPILMIGFYTLYLAKSERGRSWRPAARAATAVVAFSCFAFVAYSWTENHMLALDKSAWVTMYAAGDHVYGGSTVVVRFCFWLLMSAPIMAAIAGWQLWVARARGDDRDDRDDEGMRVGTRRLGVLALGGLCVASLPAWLLWRELSDASAEVVTSGAVAPYLALASVGVLAQLAAWGAQLRAGRVAPSWLAVAGTGAFLTVLGGAVVRESLRIATLGEPGLFALHDRASNAGGMPLFFVFLIVNGAIIGWCLRLTRRGLRAD